MKFITNIRNPDELQSLSDELKKVGVSSFRIDFGAHHILTINNEAVKEDEIECALRKAGCKCVCFKKCNYKA
ncbi:MULTISPECIES: hypothetical protein [Emticicia]|uniref:hypothetical protein n=1 Tax=Emticicia TaxID=312278 RepID=UPI0020A09924|nr:MULTISPECIES: hypothetical protein [Emticicia]UTA70223.1 hypothetical protein MB380_10450 [Emticicia sp. 21SJ11W-3]